MSSNPIRVGIVGLGRSGFGIHATNMPQLPDMYRIVAVTDLIPQRLSETAAQLNAKACPSIEALLREQDVELVVVSSFNYLHVDNAVMALIAGKHVLCEKPFGMRVADVDRMINAACQAGKVLQPFQQRRYEPDHKKVMEIIASGILGQIKFARICWHTFKRRWDWQTLTRFSGGELNNNGPHLIDHAMEIFGEGVEPEVWAEKLHCLCSGDAEDHIKIILRGPAGSGKPTIEIELSSVFAYGQDRWLICGTSGGLRGGADKLEWKYVDWSQMPPRPVTDQPTPDRSYNSEPLTWQTGTWTATGPADKGGGAAPAMQPALDLYRDLYETIRHGKPQVITPQSVRRRVAIIERSHQLCPRPR